MKIIVVTLFLFVNFVSFSSNANVMKSGDWKYIQSVNLDAGFKETLAMSLERDKVSGYIKTGMSIQQLKDGYSVRFLNQNVRLHSLDDVNVDYSVNEKDFKAVMSKPYINEGGHKYFTLYEEFIEGFLRDIQHANKLFIRITHNGDIFDYCVSLKGLDYISKHVLSIP
ncbi:hypothetical protein VINI7043_00517 [Vibrio nigripulchritudo ATCC 27043]|nr:MULTISPECIES: hypothetical protein [Vibrio]EGU61560.1 hypothetical protein VINI7043_00517 [Vibrio nigripulchritudo ATCC 27043]UAB74017.1 hypothetical protein INR79_23050 [Vibrio sp. SCSIO 43132]BDU45611.1 hypothetical protein TUMSATVNIG3_44090 [Vibrio nigripulchritudo]